MKVVKYLLYVLASLIAVLVVGLLYVLIAFPKVSPPTDMKVEITPEKVERGRYLAYHVMMCADCHSIRNFDIYSGPPIPGTEFVGGDIFDQSMGFPGKFISSNITPYGIGDWTDGELFRLVTTGVTRENRAIFPVMPYHNFGKLDPVDIESVIAFLRTLEPVEKEHPKSKADFPFSLILKTIPGDPSFTIKPDQNDKVAYGKYLYTAAACGDCHTNFEKGKFVGPDGGGGREFEMPDGSVLRTANLTPHETGLLHYNKDVFVKRFKMYTDSNYVLPKVKSGEMQTIMPWYMYSGMTEDDLSAIYDYLQTLTPYDNYVVKYDPPK